MVQAPSRRRFSFFLPLFLLLGSFLLSACNSDRFPGPFFIVTRSEVAFVDKPGLITINSTCKNGNQLLGGGYALIEGSGVGTIEQLGVLASYPSTPDTWTLKVNVPSQTFQLVQGSYIMGFAYCLTTPNYPVGVIIATAGTRGQGMPFPQIAASCPSGSVLTGGGYETGATGTGNGLWNSNVMMSAPTFDVSKHATGWQVGLAYVFGETPPQTTVYALCATKNLVSDITVVAPLDLTKLLAAYDYREQEALCPERTFTTGGGYSLIGDAAIPHPVLFSNSRQEFGTWRFRVLYGFQTTQYPTRPCDPNLNPDCARIAAIAACVRVPDIPFVKIKITSPNDHAVLPLTSDQKSTQAVTFAAQAFDESGATLSDIQWFRDGIYFGTGPSVSTAWPVSGLGDFKIKAVATGKTTTASDQITVSAGVIQ
jgi:hypothetical protein